MQGGQPRPVCGVHVACRLQEGASVSTAASTERLCAEGCQVLLQTATAGMLEGGVTRSKLTLTLMVLPRRIKAPPGSSTDESSRLLAQSACECCAKGDEFVNHVLHITSGSSFLAILHYR